MAKSPSGKDAKADASPSSSPSRTLGHRYDVIAQIGQGGVATVHEAYDSATKRRIALKRILPRDKTEDHERSVRLFEGEFHTLSQLAHPRIVEAYDYSVDEQGPYYTMELLDGGDLQQLAPVDWRKACAIARDVCSALSLLHSRRLVHRDVSPRNVRCTSNGLAKLIDFGAMVPVGAAKHGVVGTPPCTAPEVLQGLSLDARTDLYGLGATLYYALTGRHAYPAKTFADLAMRWAQPPPRPSNLAQDIPPALGALVLDLLQLDPAARPANAMEVIERLCAIEGSSPSDHLQVAQAYLSTPVLVGRATQLRRAARVTRRALRGQGGALLVQGASGVGRSRFLDACILEAKLHGATVLRANSDEGRGTDYGALRALVSSLLAIDPDAAVRGQDVDRLRPLLPKLGRSASDAALRDPETSRAELQSALRGWLVELSRDKPLFIAVDDLHRIDEPSLAWMALLVHDLGNEAIAVVATAETGAPTASNPALKMFSDRARWINLGNLDPEDTENLLLSVFGDVPNVGLVADRIHEISAGNPRDTMRLAQHLVDRGAVRYAAGAWTLPSRFDATDLPSSVSQALASRVQALSEPARQLARTLSLCQGIQVSLDECVLLGEGNETRIAVECIDELIHAEILRSTGQCFELAQRAWAPILSEGLDPEESRRLHLRLATLFERREDAQFRVGQHLIRGGEFARGIETLARQSEAIENESRRDTEQYVAFIRSLPPDWYETYAEAIRLCGELGRPKKERYLLRTRVAALAPVAGTADKVHLPDLISQLCDDCGLTDWNRLVGHEAGPRLMAALKAASERYASTPDHERVLDPKTAIRQLARVLIQTASVLTSAFDVRGARSLPSLGPLVPLSPAIGVIERMTQGMISRMTGRTELARQAYADVLARTAEPDRAGLDESHHTNMRGALIGGFGMIEAGMGLSSSLDWARKLDAEALYQVNSLHIRMLHHLWQGNQIEAARCKHDVELLRIQRSARQFFEGTHLIWELPAYAFLADLTRTKQAIAEIEPIAERHPGWRPVLHYGLGEYHRLRGDPQKALKEVEAGLEQSDAGEHQMWPYLAAAHLHVLREMGRAAEALELGDAYVPAAEQSQLGYLTNYLLLARSLVQATLGHTDAALETAERVIDDFRALGTTGLNLAIAYETRARLAILLGDAAKFEEFASRFRETFESSSSPALAAKFEKLSREVRGIGVADPDRAEQDLANARVLSVFDVCEGFADRARCVLSSLAEASGATEGYLFLLSGTGPACAAQLGESPAPARIRSFAEDYLAGQVSAFGTITHTDSSGATWDTSASAEGQSTNGYRTVLLSHPAGDGTIITGVALLSVPAGAAFSYPARLASELSKRVEMSGDVTTMIVAS